MTTLPCPAKVNLFLAIQGKDASGYHLVDTVLMRCDEVQDFLTIEPSDRLSFDCPSLPVEQNLVLKALRLLERETGKSFLYSIRLEKHIPLRSGLGGGSSDAAAILLYLNEAEQLHFSREKLMELAIKLGMDVPFFVSGFSVARSTHYGEKVSSLLALPRELHVSLHFTDIEVSTEEAYAAWDKSGFTSSADSTPFLEALQRGDAHGILNGLHNDFERIFPSKLSSNDPRGKAILCGCGGAYAVLAHHLPSLQGAD